MEQNQGTSIFGLSIDPASKVHLAEAAKWARFLAIIGFIFLAVFVILAIFGGTYLSTMFNRNSRTFDTDVDGFATGYAVGVIIYYLIVALLVFFVYLFLYRFATKMKYALAANNQDALNASFQNLKILFRYIGILTIISCSLFIILLLIAIVGAAAAG